jgi:ATP-dependent Clp protease ATP-binding subunit ClpA
MSDTKTFTFDDTVISTIAKTLQLAILTGTDVVDNLRQIEVQENDNGTLSITPNYNSKFEHWVAKLLEELESQQDEVQTENPEEVKGLFE